METGIYNIINTANGKRYIGQTVYLYTRRRKHFNALKIGRHVNMHLQAAYNKYGSSCFEFRILEICSEEMLDARECAWIKYYQSDHKEFGYNKQTGGGVGRHFSEDMRNKLSEAHRGHKHTEEQKRKIGNASRGHVKSAETIQKIKDAWAKRRMLGLSTRNKGTKHGPLSEAHKLKISLKNQGRTQSPEEKQRRSVANLGQKRDESTKEKHRILYQKHKENGFVLSFKGGHHSDETRNILSEKLRGKPSWAKGLKFTPEHRLNISIARQGMHHSEETKKAMSLAQIARYQRELRNVQAKEGVA